MMSIYLFCVCEMEREYSAVIINNAADTLQNNTLPSAGGCTDCFKGLQHREHWAHYQREEFSGLAVSPAHCRTPGIHFLFHPRLLYKEVRLSFP